MKALIVTTQYIKNYGAVLQSYGMHKFLNNNGYKHAFLKQVSRANSIYERLTPIGRNTIAGLSYNALIFLKRKELYARHRSFDDFCAKYIPEVDISKADDFDLYITGGDQMFNRSCLNTPNNFLKFGRDNAKRISFCTSLGSAKFSEEEYRFISSSLSSYSEISLREQNGVDALKPYVDIPIRTDIDCSFLIDKQDWIEIAKPLVGNVPKEFILVYELMHHGDINEVVQKVKKETNLPVVAILTKPRKSFQADICLYDVGPQEFVWLFNKATHIITTSFHGTCFSIINEKPFTVLVQNNEKRITALLDEFGLSSYYFSKYQGELNLEAPDFEAAKNQIANGRKNAQQYFEKHFRMEDN